MKKCLKTLLIIILAFPVFTKAIVNYDEGVKQANRYIDSFEEYSKYILINDDFSYVFENGELINDTNFRKGGFLSRTEFEITNINGKTYLAPGIQYWTLTNGKSDKTKYSVNYKLQEYDKTKKAGVRVTEYIKPDVLVKGKGSLSSPWEFVEQYKVTFTSDEKYGRVYPNEILVSASGANVEARPIDGYYYNSIECNAENNFKVTNGTNNIATIWLQDVEKDMNCFVKFGAKKYSITYSGVEGILNNNPSYYIENEGATIGSVSKDGYSFDGWTGSNGEEPELRVIIPVGTTGNKEYKANWTKSSIATKKCQELSVSCAGKAVAGKAPYDITYGGECEYTCDEYGSWNMKLLGDAQTHAGTHNLTFKTKMKFDAFLVGGGGGGYSNSWTGYNGGGGGGYTGSYFGLVSNPNTNYSIVIGEGGKLNKSGKVTSIVSEENNMNYSVKGGGSGGITGGGGGSGGGGTPSGSDYGLDYGGGGGSYGNNGGTGAGWIDATVISYGRAVDGYHGGKGQGTTTCEFKEGNLNGCDYGKDKAYAGGGGGTSGANGGVGGGGKAGSSGMPNTGGGGGGVKGSGGSGVVIIRGSSLVFNDQLVEEYYSIHDRKINYQQPFNGSGKYTNTIISGNNEYFIFNGAELIAKAYTPVGTYKLTVTSKDNVSNKQFTRIIRVKILKKTPIVEIINAPTNLVANETYKFKVKSDARGKYSVASESSSFASANCYTERVAAETESYVVIKGLKQGTSKIRIEFRPTDTKNYKDKVEQSINVSVTNVEIAKPDASKCNDLIFNDTDQVLMNDSTGYVVTDNIQKKSGKYKVTAILKTGYIWSGGSKTPITVDCEIKKQKVKIPTSENCIDVTYNNKNQVIFNSETGYSVTYKQGNKEITNLKSAGKYTIIAKLNNNYYWENESTGSKEVICEIKPLPVKIPTSENCIDLVYKGVNQTMSNALTGYSLVDNVKKNVSDDYQITAILSNTNYIWDDDEKTRTNKKYSCSIKKATRATTYTGEKYLIEDSSINSNLITNLAGTYSIEGYNDLNDDDNTFRKSSNIITAGFNNTAELNKKAAKANVNVKITIKGTKNGTTKIKVKFTPEDTASYNENIEIYEITVSNGKVKIPDANDCNDLVYNGKSQVLMNDGQGYKVTLNTKNGTEVKKYNVSLKLDKNYKWDDGSLTGSIEPKTIECEIKQQEVKTPICNELTYNGKEQVLMLKDTGYNISNNKLTNAGSKTVKVSLSNNNYIWDDKTDSTKEIECNIKPKPLKIPSNENCIEAKYNGYDQKISNALQGYGLKNNVQKEAGTYLITAALSNTNFIWADNSTTNKTYQCNIEKATIATNINGVNYLTTEKAISNELKTNQKGTYSIIENTNPDVASVELSKINEVNPNVAINMKITGLEIGETSVKIKFSFKNEALYNENVIDYKIYVIKKAVDIPTSSICNNLVYNGSKQKLVTEGPGYVIADYVGKNAGDYNVKATIASEYSWSNDSDVNTHTVTCRIEKAPTLLATSISNINIPELDTMSFTAFGSKIGTISVVSNSTAIAVASSESVTKDDTTTATINVKGISNGKTSLVVTFIPDNVNFETKITTIDVNVQ